MIDSRAPGRVSNPVFRAAIGLLVILGLTALPASAADLASVQNGSVVMPISGSSAQTLNVTISSVDLSRSILFFNYRGNSGQPGDGQVRGQLTSGTNIRFYRANASSITALTVEWYVVEFQSGVTVQRGTLTGINSSSTVGISAVNLNNSFAMVSGSVGGNNNTYGRDDYFRTRLLNSTTLEIAHDQNSTSQTADWQVIEYTDSTVQRGIGSLSDTTLSVNIPITAVNLAKSMVVVSWRTNANGTGNNFIKARLTSPTQITIDRAVSGSVIGYAWQVVEFTDGSSVEAGELSYSTSQSSQTATLPSINTSRAVALLSSAAGRWGGTHSFISTDETGPGMFTTDITNSTTLTVTRSNTGSVPAAVNWFVVQFGNCSVDADCDDGLYCNGAETCSSGTCQAGTTVNCDDSVGCTDDSCNESTDSCEHVTNDGNCDNGQYCDGLETCDVVNDCQAGTAVNCSDGVGCTDDSCNESTDSCAHVTNDGNCDNGQFCDGLETCDVVNDCQAGTPVNCSDGVGCTDDSCNESTDSCDHVANDGNCANGLFCDGVETCNPALDCQAGTPVDCSDGIGCTNDTCDEVGDVCINTPDNGACDNGLFCDGLEVCDIALDCQPGTAPNCDDGVGCTSDSCNESTDSCDHVPSNAVCDNGLFCDGVETCHAVLDCQAGAAPNCNDGIACTVDSCDEAGDACTNAPDDTLCNNGQFCDGVETCDAALGCQNGTAPNCDDGVGCTIDSCDESGDSCVNTPDNSSCDNGQFCDGAETCDPVLDCQTPGLSCDDSDACTTDSCNEAGDTCVNTPIGGCQSCSVAADCDDGIPCTIDSCNAGVCVRTTDDSVCDNGLYCDGAESCDQALGCQAASPINCDDSIGCTVDSCDEGADTCVHAANDSLCNNGQFCDGVETCDVNFDCQAGTPVTCNDGVGCTIDSCDEVNDVCVNTPDDTVCDNGQFCDGAETCDDTLDCQSGTPLTCDDGVGCTLDVCDEVNDSCVNTADNSACDNGLFCDGLETCDATFDCQSGTPRNCSDGIGCTIDSCDEVNDSCLNTPNDAACDNGQYCDGAETCDAALDCQAGAPPDCDDGIGCTVDSCDEGGDTCVNAPNAALCDNGQFCDGVESCDPVLDCQPGASPPIDDGVACTDDSCDEVNDVIVNQPNNVHCDNNLFCDGAETCHPTLDCQSGTVINCDDAVACTDDSCNETTDSCDNTVNHANCDNGAFCDGLETCDSVADCQAGTAPDCNDGVACTIDSCDEVNDVCVQTPDDALCDNGQFCDGSETCDSINDCQAGTPVSVDDGVSCTDDSCDETNDVVVNIPNDANCDNGQFCDGAETCDPVGDCQSGILSCDDADACTIDTCDEGNDTCVNSPIGGCTSCSTAAECDDSIACTTDTCSAGVCVHTPVDNVCDNGLFCDGAETCSPTMGCQAGTPINCDDSVACTVDNCDEGADTCTHVATDALCDNGQFCDGAETCDAMNGCQAGTPVACDDGVGCTSDSCDEVDDTCVNVPTNSLCDNGLFCDGIETCHTLLDCQAGTPPPIDDGVGCTDDSCDEVNDVVVHAANDGHCDNGLFCDGLETCDAIGDCQAGTPVVCNDGIGCTVDSCDEGSDSCAFVPTAALCDNGQFCDGVETCDPALDCQAGTPISCDDSVACTIDSCDEVNDTCVNVANNGACDNGLFCDGVESCDPVLGCLAGTAPDCTDAVACTVDSCDEGSDSCVNTPTNSLCDNGQFCDGAETCDGVLGCQAGTAVNCADAIGCTVDSCDEVADACVNAPNNSLCDNAQFCDGAETCDALLGCQPGLAPNCDDGIGCTADSCDEANDTCVNAPGNAACDNGLFCDGLETCDPTLDCQAGTPPNCADGVGCTVDSCDEGADTCVHTVNNALCDNGQFCDGVETCDVSLDCQSGSAPTIDDGIACTDDSCDEVNDVVVNTVNHANCDDALFCNGSETCDAALDCQAGTAPTIDDGIGCTDDSCDEVNDVVVHAVNHASCDDTLFCNGTETCDAALDCQAGTAPDCNDTIACTVDACDEGTDSCTHVVDDSLCDNGQFCDGVETCDALLDCQAGTAPDCDDAVTCTVDSCDETNDVCVNAASDALCDNGQFCDGAETCHATLDCQSPVFSCDDSDACTTDACDEGADACVKHTYWWVHVLCDRGGL